MVDPEGELWERSNFKELPQFLKSSRISLAYGITSTRGVQKVLGPTMKEQRYDIDFIYQKALFLHIITVKTNALLAPLR